MAKVFISKQIEPDLSKKFERMDIAAAYNFYNVTYEAEDAKEFAVSYLKSIKFDKEKINRLSHVPTKMFINTIGWNARILSRGGKLPEDYVKRMYENIDKLIDLYNVPVEVKASKVPETSIQDKVQSKINFHIANFEDEIDKNLIDEDHEFSAYEYLRKNEVKPMIARAIADYYIPIFNEYVEVFSGSDDQLKEAYLKDKSSKSVVYKHMKFVEAIVNDCETFSKNAKKERKPRKKKAKSADKVVSKIKFKDKDDKYKVSSIPAADIVGSQQLWIFNSKTRFLGVYNAYGPNGLSMKGTTITGFDDKTSISKKLRKPEVTLKEVVDGGKVALRKIMSTLKAKEKVLNGRINKDTILLRVTKGM